MANSAERPVAVYRVHPVAFWASLFIALLLDVSLPVKMPLARLFDFPALMTIYFAAIGRSKIFGVGLGASIGLVQDALSHGLLGMSGIANTLVGYFAAYVGIKFDMEQLGARYVLAGALVLVHSLALAALSQILLESPTPVTTLGLAATVVVNVGLALIGYPILDRFKYHV
ncbi:MAG: rod shape-determining protein MreD [Terriglobia bacterium]